MRTINFDSMEKAAQAAKLERFRSGIFPVKKVRSKPRDPETLAVIQELARSRAERSPMRFVDGKLYIPALELTPKESELARAWLDSLGEKEKP